MLASQWGAEFDARLLAVRPELELIALPRRLAWPLPARAEVLLALPFVPEDQGEGPPVGWPFGLRWIQLVSVGIDNYPRWFLAGPSVSTARGSSSQTISDFVLACVLHHGLRLHARRVSGPAQWKHHAAPALAGSTLGLFGFGGIGQALARKALALGLRVIALRRSASPFGIDGVEAARDLADLVARSDHLALVAPGTQATRHVIDAAALRHAQPHLHLINVSRGSLVDQDALRAALDDGRLAYASLDVTEPEPLPEGHWLYAHPRVLLTPHTCAISPQVHDVLLARVLEGLAAYAQGRPPPDRVDLARGY